MGEVLAFERVRVERVGDTLRLSYRVLGGDVAALSLNKEQGRGVVKAITLSYECGIIATAALGRVGVAGHAESGKLAISLVGRDPVEMSEREAHRFICKLAETVEALPAANLAL